MIGFKKGENFTSFNSRFRDWACNLGERGHTKIMQDVELTNRWATEIYMRASLSGSALGQALFDDAEQRPLLVKGNEIFIYGDIGSWWDEVGFESLVDAVDRIENKNAPVTVRINSRGGLVSEGYTMSRYFRDIPNTVNTIVDGQASSMAASIFMAGESRLMNNGTHVMFHQPMAMAVGNSADLRKRADVMDWIRDHVAETMQNKAGMEKDRALQMINEETFLNPRMAIDEGIATGMDTGKPEPVNMLDDSDLTMLNRSGYKVPENMRQLNKRVDALLAYSGTLT